jgi:hypothetical protein
MKMKTSKNRLSRDQKRKRNTTIILVICVICMSIALAYQAISDTLNKNLEGHLNYLGQPVTPGLQLVTLAIAIIAVILWAWQKLFRKKETKEKKKSGSPR